MNPNPTEPDDLTSLYFRPFAEYGVSAPWNLRPVEKPSPADALAITKALRTHSGMEGRRLAEGIEAVVAGNLADQPRLIKRQFGAMRGVVNLGPEFFDPLPEDELSGWE